MPYYRKPISINHTKVLNSDHKDVPVLIVLTDPDLKSTDKGGRVSHPGGDDIFFSLPDSETRLPHEIIAYIPETGRVNAWVRIPELSCTRDTELYLYYGNLDAAQTGGEVWDSHYKLVHRINAASEPEVELPHSDGLDIRDEKPSRPGSTATPIDRKRCSPSSPNGSRYPLLIPSTATMREARTGWRAL